MSKWHEKLEHGCEVKVVLKGDHRDRDEGLVWREATGMVQAVASMRYILDSARRGSFGMPLCLQIPLDMIETVELVRTEAQRKEDFRAAARGEPYFAWRPESALDYEEQLSVLAGEISRLDFFDKRRKQLLVQFGELADEIGLSETKRTYVLKREQLGVGDFNPGEWKTDDVFRIKTHRAFPLDFEPDAKVRKDAKRREAEALKAFGAPERETRALLSWMRAKGFDAARTHPNAFRIKVKLDVGERKPAEAEIRCSENGLWELSPIGWNRSESKRRAKAMRLGLYRAATDAVQAWIEADRPDKGALRRGVGDPAREEVAAAMK